MVPPMLSPATACMRADHLTLPPPYTTCAYMTSLTTGVREHHLLQRNMADTRLYDLLGVKPNASDAEIKKVRYFEQQNGINFLIVIQIM